MQSPPTVALSSDPPQVIQKSLRQILKSPRNIFGLFRQYHATDFPAHDPERVAEKPALSTQDDSNALPESSSAPSFYPYPNRSSFLLGEWYWNDGVRKSQSSFKNLIDIVGSTDFRPEDVRKTPWSSIDRKLAGQDEDNWEDEQEEDGWIHDTVKISIPFHKKCLQPGAQDYVVTSFHHRRLVSVIKEKITNPTTFPHLHLEPYKLLCQPGSAPEAVQVHGEAYTSEAFLDAHNALQESPGEPGCSLERVVAALMFASDGTHLSTFGDAKLWPAYLALGNESKYRRCKPSCRSFTHIAYFEKVNRFHSTDERH